MTKRTGSLTRSLTVDVLTDLESASSISDEWDALAEQVNTQPFRTTGHGVGLVAASGARGPSTS
ncbi:MAG: hypothetical protein R2710_30990 [Acidimicrobiales bacterium]